MEERPTIAFRVDESQKETWKTYAEDNPEYDSLSHLLRVAVAHEMSDQYGVKGHEGGGGSEQVGELVTVVNKMDSRLEEVEEKVQDATEAAYTSVGHSSDAPSEGELLTVIPYGKENAILSESVAAEVGVTDQATVSWIDMKLNHMEQKTGAIKSLMEGGYSSFGEAMASDGSATTVRWYREE